tara:strand:+ start:250 stop:486 length:237 start_codon:yes stop_codon:yes gene_type:complete
MVETPTFDNTLNFKLFTNNRYTVLFKSLNYCKNRLKRNYNIDQDFILSRTETFEVTLMINQPLLEVALTEIIRLAAFQ